MNSLLLTSCSAIANLSGSVVMTFAPDREITSPSLIFPTNCSSSTVRMLTPGVPPGAPLKSCGISPYKVVPYEAARGSAEPTGSSVITYLPISNMYSAAAII